MKVTRRRFKITRRSFIVALLAIFSAAIFWWARRLDIPPAIADFFGLQHVPPKLIKAEFQRLKKHNVSLFFYTTFFFSLSQRKAHHLLPLYLRERVVQHWSRFLFNRRRISWPYTGYLKVSNVPICNGLVRLPDND